MNATALIRNDDILIDGNDGVVIINPDDQTLVEDEERQERYRAYRSHGSPVKATSRPARSTTASRCKAISNCPRKSSVSVIDNGDGIGLYRTEFQYMSRTDFPNEFELYDKYRDVVEVMAPNPVILIGTLDVNADKTLSYASNGNEVNPALGLRAIRYCLQNPEASPTTRWPSCAPPPTGTCASCFHDHRLRN